MDYTADETLGTSLGTHPAGATVVGIHLETMTTGSS